MQFRSILAFLSLSVVVVVGRHAAPPRPSVVGRYAAPPQPSSTDPWYGCPDTNTSNNGKVTELCDSPPHAGSIFGCTYRTGKGTGTHSCTYKAKTGECTSNDSRCPTYATVTRSHKRRDTSTF